MSVQALDRYPSGGVVLEIAQATLRPALKR
jgi:hypothetical protein